MLIVVQDWEFPTFEDVEDSETMVAGTFETEIHFQWLDRLLEKVEGIACIQWLKRHKIFDVKITGKWINFGPLFIIIGLDLNMMKNQLLYQPSDFGQYTDPSTNRIWTVTDTALLKQL